MDTATPPRVCVVIVSYNSSETLPRCLSALAAQTYRDFQVLLIDNASRERPHEILAQFPLPSEYMEMEENLGFAGAMNVAVDAVRCPFVAALNPDAFPRPDWLAELVKAADHYESVAAFGSLQISAADSSCVDGYGDGYLVWGQAWRARSWPGSDAARAEFCFGVCAAAALYRADALRKAGGFDPRFFCFYEDVDVSFRLRLAGHHCAVVPAAKVDHVGGASFAGKSDLADYLSARNQWWVLMKDMPWPILIVSVPGIFLIHLAAAIKSPRASRLKGLWDGLRRTPEFLMSRRAIQARRRISAAELARWLSWRPAAFIARSSAVKKSAPN